METNLTRRDHQAQIHVRGAVSEAIQCGSNNIKSASRKVWRDCIVEQVTKIEFLTQRCRSLLRGLLKAVNLCAQWIHTIN